MSLSPVHVGKGELHVPLPWQVMISDPDSEYPPLHAKLTVLPPCTADRWLVERLILFAHLWVRWD